MPDIRSYVVTQEREVKVSSTCPEEAVRIAEAAFGNGQDDYGNAKGVVEETIGNTTTRIRTIEVRAREDY